MPKDNEREIRCSFCGKTRDEVTQLVEGNGVYICESCVSFCNSLIFDTEADARPARKRKKAQPAALPKPQEIKAKLDDYEHAGDMYKVKTYQAMTKLEKNGLFSAPVPCH